MRHHRGGDRRVILRGVTYTDRLGEGVDLLEMVCDASCLMKQENGLSIGAGGPRRFGRNSPGRTEVCSFCELAMELSVTKPI